MENSLLLDPAKGRCWNANRRDDLAESNADAMNALADAAPVTMGHPQEIRRSRFAAILHFDVRAREPLNRKIRPAR